MSVNMDVNNLPITSNQATAVPIKPSKTSNTGSSRETKSQDLEVMTTVDPVVIEKQIQDSQEQIDHIMEEIKEKTKDMSFSVDMRYDDRINRTIAKIVDKETGSVIREIPPEDLVKVARMIKDMAEGIIIDNQA